MTHFLALSCYRKNKLNIENASHAVHHIIKANSSKQKNSRKKLVEEKELHSHKERQRRIDLNEAFGCLREIIPSVASKDKASKLSILTSAKDYCEGLKGKLERLETIHQEELVRQRQLGEDLTSLQLECLAYLT